MGPLPPLLAIGRDLTSHLVGRDVRLEQNTAADTGTPARSERGRRGHHRDGAFSQETKCRVAREIVRDVARQDLTDRTQRIFEASREVLLIGTGQLEVGKYRACCERSTDALGIAGREPRQFLGHERGWPQEQQERRGRGPDSFGQSRIQLTAWSGFGK